MINVCDIIDFFALKLKKDEFFEQAKIIYALSDEVKPTIFEVPIIVLSIENIELLSESVGEKSKMGSYKVKCSIYSQLSIDKKTIESIFSKICDAVFDFSMFGVSAFPVRYDSQSECLVLDSFFTFNDVIGFEVNI